MTVNRDRRFWRRVLVVAALGLVLADSLLFLGFVAPLAESSRADAAGAVQTARLSSQAQHTMRALTHEALANEALANERIIVPTHDPAKPWPTRTPTPQPTPWFIPTATPVSTATSVPTIGSTSPAPTSSSTAVVAPTGAGPTMSAALPTPSTGTPADGASSAGSAAALDATRLEAATAVTPTEVAEITAAPADVAPTAEVPAADPAAGAPAATTTTADGAAPPEATATPGPAAFTPGDDAQFVTYLQSRYGALAGQTLDVAQVTLGQTPDNLPEVRVEVNVDPASNAFPATPPRPRSTAAHCWPMPRFSIPAKESPLTLLPISNRQRWMSAPIARAGATSTGSTRTTTRGTSPGRTSRGGSTADRTTFRHGARPNERQEDAPCQIYAGFDRSSRPHCTAA